MRGPRRRCLETPRRLERLEQWRRRRRDGLPVTPNKTKNQHQVAKEFFKTKEFFLRKKTIIKNVPEQTRMEHTSRGSYTAP